MNLYETIQNQMNTDSEDTDKISEELKILYSIEAETKKEKELIDGVFVALTGWRLKTLMDPDFNIKLNN